jgi:hypothetical protein
MEVPLLAEAAPEEAEQEEAVIVAGEEVEMVVAVIVVVMDLDLVREGAEVYPVVMEETVLLEQFS